MSHLTLTEARRRLLRLAEEIRRDPSEVVEVSKRGRRVLALMSIELYEAIVETLDLLGDETAHARLRQALAEVRAGRTLPWRRAKERLGLRE